MSAVPEATAPETRERPATMTAALDQLDAERGYDPVAEELAIAQPGAQQSPVAAQDVPGSTEVAPEATETSPTTAAPAQPAEEVRISKAEWDETQRRLGQYGQNLQQQRADFDERVKQAIAGQGPDIDRRIADARREAKRDAIRELIDQVADPAERRQQAADWKATWDAEDQQLATERRIAEAEQVKTQAGQQIQQAQQVVQQAQAQMVAGAMGEYLAGFAPQFTQMTSQILGEDADPDEVKAFVTRPEIVKLAAQEAMGGPEAVNRFGFTLANMTAIHLKDRKAAREEGARLRREQMDASGVGRAQAATAGGMARTDLSRFKGQRGPGVMTSVLNARDGIAD